MTPNLPPARAFLLASLATAANVAVASGFALVGVLAPQAMLPAGVAPGEASFVFALYAAARTLPLAAGVGLAVARRSTPALLVLGSLAGAIQTADAVVGLVQHDVGKTAGPLVIAALQFATLLALRRTRNTPVA